MAPIARCEPSDIPLHDGVDFAFISEGLVWVCRACVDAEEDRLRDESGRIGAWKGEAVPTGDSPEFPDREVCRDDHEESQPF